MRQGDEPVEDGVDRGKDASGEVEESKVELLPKTGHVGREGHAAKNLVLLAGPVLFDVGEVEVGVCPCLESVSLGE